MRGTVGSFALRPVDGNGNDRFDAKILVNDVRLVSVDVIVTDDDGDSTDGIIFFEAFDGQADFLPQLQADGAILDATLGLDLVIDFGGENQRSESRTFEFVHLADASDGDRDDRFLFFADTLEGSSREIVLENRTYVDGQPRAKLPLFNADNAAFSVIEDNAAEQI